MSTATFLASKKSTIVPYLKPLATRAYFGLMGRVFPTYMQRLAVRLFTTPPPYSGRTVHPIDTRRENVTAGERTIAVWQAGAAEAPAVLLVHGWGGRGLQLGAFVEPLLAAGFRVVWFDQPGHGESDQGRSGLPDFVRSVNALASTHGPFAAAIGHSLGAGAVGLAIRAGLAIERVVMISAPSSITEHTQSFTRLLGLAPRFASRMRLTLERRYGISFAELDRVEALSASRAEVLLIHDKLDRQVEYRHALRLHGALRSARLLPTYELGHFRIIRDARVVCAAIDFISGKTHALPEAIPSLPLPAPMY